MRLVGLAALGLAVACSSSSGLENQLIQGDAGQPITVSISGVDNSVSIPDRDDSRQYTVEVEVANDGDVPLTVTQISIRTDGSGAFQVSPSGNRFNEMIDPGKDHLFELVTRGRFVRPFRPEESHTVLLRVLVSLSNGDTYAYAFEGPVRDAPSRGMPLRRRKLDRLDTPGAEPLRSPSLRNGAFV